MEKCAKCGRSIDDPLEIVFAWRCPKCNNTFCRACGGGGKQVGVLTIIDPGAMDCPLCAEKQALIIGGVIVAIAAIGFAVVCWFFIR